MLKELTHWLDGLHAHLVLSATNAQAELLLKSHQLTLALPVDTVQQALNTVPSAQLAISVSILLASLPP